MLGPTDLSSCLRLMSNVHFLCSYLMALVSWTHMPPACQLVPVSLVCGYGGLPVPWGLASSHMVCMESWIKLYRGRTFDWNRVKHYNVSSLGKKCLSSPFIKSEWYSPRIWKSTSNQLWVPENWGFIGRSLSLHVRESTAWCFIIIIIIMEKTRHQSWLRSLWLMAYFF